jgi:hypothetical protein
MIIDLGNNWIANYILLLQVIHQLRYPIAKLDNIVNGKVLPFSHVKP